MNENKLVKKAIKGDGKAFEKLLELHSDQLYRTAFLYVGNRDDALDVVQETAYKSFQAVGQLKNTEYFLTWVTRILIHCSYDLLRKKNREIPMNRMKEKAEEFFHQEESLDLGAAINLLNEQYRTVILLFYYRDLSIHDIAEIMSIPENTVKTYLHRAKRNLRKSLEGAGYLGQENLS
ncbi:sigma-70 family RNA polymerase sigma factor [Peribacillus sp. NPDC097295]|uniref:sigma-70 family RNA polymerase sigma factor n=1 Tax=Peribacillus sp. NPDC097295 TaxID=3364402 RepID=UPI003811A233